MLCRRLVHMLFFFFLTLVSDRGWAVEGARPGQARSGQAEAGRSRPAMLRHTGEGMNVTSQCLPASLKQPATLPAPSSFLSSVEWKLQGAGGKHACVYVCVRACVREFSASRGASEPGCRSLAAALSPALSTGGTGRLRKTSSGVCHIQKKNTPRIHLKTS